MNYETVRVRFDGPVCFLQLYRPQAGNTINDRLVTECHQVLDGLDAAITVIVLEGLPEVFCFGADFNEIQTDMAAGRADSQGPEPLYDLWQRLATGPYVTVAYVRGRVNAGGVGFVAACDIVLAAENVQFSLSELLFGLFPACVLPFLIRRVGFQKAHYLTLMTKPITSRQALDMGLIDACEGDGAALLRKHLLRLRRLSASGIRRYKNYMNAIHPLLSGAKSLALAANREIFSDPVNLEGIYRYVTTGRFPWEGES